MFENVIATTAVLTLMPKFLNKKQLDGTVLDQAQLRLELCFAKLKISCKNMIQLFKFCKLSGATLIIIPSKSEWKLLGYGRKYHR